VDEKKGKISGMLIYRLFNEIDLVDSPADSPGLSILRKIIENLKGML
jgi:hypothetical protein